MAADLYSAEYYAARESWYDWRVEAQTLIRLAHLSKPGRVLEIGCGSGGLLKFVADKEISAIGVDTRCGALELARNRSDLTTWIHLVQIAPSGPLAFAENTFDAILAQHVVEHISNLDEALGEWKRVLRPGGRLAIATPNALYPDPAHFQDGEHVCLFTPDELKSRVERSGFAVDSVSTCFAYLTRLRPLRAFGVRAYGLFQRLPYFAWHGRTLVLGGRAAK